MVAISVILLATLGTLLLSTTGQPPDISVQFTAEVGIVALNLFMVGLLVQIYVTLNRIEASIE